MKISEAIDQWLTDLGLYNRPDITEHDFTSVIQDHAPLPHTARSYRHGTDRFLEMLESEFQITPDNDLTSINITHFIRFVTWIQKVYTRVDTHLPVEISTQKQYIAGVHHWYEWLKINGHYEPTPQEDFRYRMGKRKAFPRSNARDPRMADEGAVDAVLAQVLLMDTPSPRKERDIAVVYLMAHSGLRVHEVCKLKIGDINFKSRRGVIIGKGNKQAPFRFSKEALGYILAYLEARKWGRNENDPLFAAHDRSAGVKRPKHRHLTPTSIRVMVDNIAELAGVSAWPHAFRHHFVTRTYEQSKDIVLTQALARHSQIEMTRRYVDMLDGEIDEKYRAIFDGGKP